MPPAPTNARTHTLFFQRLLRNCELCIVRAVLLRHCTSRTSMNVCVCVCLSADVCLNLVGKSGKESHRPWPYSPACTRKVDWKSLKLVSPHCSTRVSWPHIGDDGEHFRINTILINRLASNPFVVGKNSTTQKRFSRH